MHTSDCLELISILIKSTDAHVSTNALSDGSTNMAIFLCHLEWLTRLLSADVCQSIKTGRSSTVIVTDHDFVVPLINNCLGSVSTCTSIILLTVDKQRPTGVTSSTESVDSVSVPVSVFVSVAAATLSQVCECAVLVIEALTHRGNLLYSSMPVLSNAIRLILVAFRHNPSDKVIAVKIPRLFSALTRNTMFFKRQAHIWCSLLIDCLARTSDNLQSIEGIKYGLFTVLDQMNTKQKKLLHSLSDPPARAFLMEIQRFYSADYKFIGKA
jgi:hypothetical protein